MSVTTNDRGSILPVVPIMALVMLMLAGLVIDASRQLNARGQAVAYAEEGARAGAQAIQPQQPLTLDPAEAGDLVAEYCSTVLAQQHVTGCELIRLDPAPDGPPRPLVVVVRVETQIPTTLLGMVGVQSLSASGEGRAQPVEGVLDVPEPVPAP